MSDPDQNPEEEIRGMLEAMQKRLRRLAVAVVLLTLAVAVLAAAVYGNLVNYFSGDPLLFGGTLIAAALLGFGFGWFARSLR